MKNWISPCLIMVIVSAWVRLNSLNEYNGIPNALIVEHRLVDLWKLKWIFCLSSHLCPTVPPYMCTFKTSHFKHAVGWKFVWRILTLQRFHSYNHIHQKRHQLLLNKLLNWNQLCKTILEWFRSGLEGSNCDKPTTSLQEGGRGGGIFVPLLVS